METVHVATGIIVHDERVLACRHQDGKGAPGSWEFPGGPVEPGESREEAVSRAIFEGLGIALRTRWYLDTIEADCPTSHLSMDCLVCPLDSRPEPVLREHAEVRWLGRDELLSVEWLGADASVALMLGTFWDHIFGSEHL